MLRRAGSPKSPKIRLPTQILDLELEGVVYRQLGDSYEIEVVEEETTMRYRSGDPLDSIVEVLPAAVRTAR